MTAAEAAQVIHLDVMAKSISDMTGLAFFSGLETLYCSDNTLGTLDLSKNPALSVLECEGAGLTALNVSANTALQTLNLKANSLTSLDLSNNTSLEYLGCRGNQLTVLNISNNSALIGVDCRGNQLTSLDLSKNSSLTGINCDENQLSSLNVSNNTALNNLTCSDNKLTTLDISKNTVLEALVCGNNFLTALDVSNNKMLEELGCQNNQLTSLDVSQNTSLRGLSCSGNYISSLDVSGNTKLIDIHCGNNQLTTLDLSKNTELIYQQTAPGTQQGGSVTAIKTGGSYYIDLTPLVGAANLSRVCNAENSPLSVDANGRVALGTTLPEIFTYYYDTQASIANRYMEVKVSISGATDVDPAPAQPAAVLSEISPSSYERYTGNEGDSCVFSLDGSLSMNGQTSRYGNTGVNGEVFGNGFEVWIARWNGIAEISWVRTKYALDGKYTALTGRTGLIKSYNTTNFDTTVYFYNGEQLLASYRLTPTNYTYTIQVDLTGVQELTLFVQDNVAVSGGTSFALADLMLYE